MVVAIEPLTTSIAKATATSAAKIIGEVSKTESCLVVEH
jgi:hypothetical protein